MVIHKDQRFEVPNYKEQNAVTKGTKCVPKYLTLFLFVMPEYFSSAVVNPRAARLRNFGVVGPLTERNDGPSTS